MIQLWFLLGCNQTWSEKYQQAPEQTLSEIQSLTSPEEKLSILMTLLQENPDQASNFCPLIEDPVQKRHCEKIQARPHLWSKPLQNQASQKSDLESPEFYLNLPIY